MNTITKKPKTKFGPRVVICFFVSVEAFGKRNGGKIHGPGLESFFVFRFSGSINFGKRNGGKIHGPIHDPVSHFPFPISRFPFLVSPFLLLVGLSL